jgi:deoxyribonuclease-4
MRIGCHLSVGKGFSAAVTEAPKLNADCFQYFTKNPRGFRGQKPLDLDDAARGRALMAELDLVAVGHAPYLINLASPDPELFQLSVDALRQDLVIGQARGSYGVVVHCGKPKSEGVAYGIGRMREGIARVLDSNPPDHILLLLENTAGQGSEIGFDLEQLLALADSFPPDRVGYCLDTQHAFAAGILNPAHPLEFEGFGNPSYLSRVHAIHFNDSKVAFGAKKDRHQLIGQGEMGDLMLKALLNDPRLKDIPFYLETPVDNQNQYAEEILHCRELLAEAN